MRSENWWNSFEMQDYASADIHRYPQGFTTIAEFRNGKSSARRIMSACDSYATEIQLFLERNFTVGLWEGRGWVEGGRCDGLTRKAKPQRNANVQVRFGCSFYPLPVLLPINFKIIFFRLAILLSNPIPPKTHHKEPYPRNRRRARRANRCKRSHRSRN